MTIPEGFRAELMQIIHDAEVAYTETPEYQEHQLLRKIAHEYGFHVTPPPRHRGRKWSRSKHPREGVKVFSAKKRRAREAYFLELRTMRDIAEEIGVSAEMVRLYLPPNTWLAVKHRKQIAKAKARRKALQETPYLKAVVERCKKHGLRYQLIRTPYREYGFLKHNISINGKSCKVLVSTEVTRSPSLRQRYKPTAYRFVPRDLTEDFLLAYIPPIETVFVIPSKKIGKQVHIIHPPKTDGHRSKWEKYREAWHLLSDNVLDKTGAGGENTHE